MFFTNGRIIIDAEGDGLRLAEAIEELIAGLQDTEPGVDFIYQTDPYTHYIIPEYISIRQLRGVLGDRLKTRAINQEELELQEPVEKEFKHYFTDEELNQQAEDLAQKIKTRDDLEEEKKRIAASYGERIKAIDAEVSKLAQYRRDKFYLEKKELIKRLDFLADRITYLDPRTREVVLSESGITTKDRQLQITFDGGDQATSAAPAPAYQEDPFSENSDPVGEPRSA